MLLLLFRSKSQIQIKEVFTLHDIDALFDDIGNYIRTFFNIYMNCMC